MYERFTDRSRKVMALANQEAQRFNHEYLGTEHILLGLIKEGSGVGAHVLKNLNVDLFKVRCEVEKLVKSGPETVTMGKLPQTPRAKKVIEYAIEEARNLGHKYVGTEHLLLGLCKEIEGIAQQVLSNLDVSVEDVRTEVVAILLGESKEGILNLEIPQNDGKTMKENISGHMRAVAIEHIRVVEAAIGQVGLLEQIADRLIACFNVGGRVYLLGNGGSAADAQHIAAELVGRFKKDRKALPAIALTTDTSILTAVSNDFSFEHVFSRQVEALVTSHDIVWALSVSGRSPNVLCALRAAKKLGATVIGFTSRSGGEMAELCDLCFRVDHDHSDRVQEVHQLAYHLICDRIDWLSVVATLLQSVAK